MNIIFGALCSFLLVATIFSMIFFFCRAVVIVVKNAYDNAKAEDRWQRTKCK